MSNSNEGLKILSAEITNFKNLKHKEIDFGGKSIMVVGPNDKGKSSFIQAIMCALNSSYKPMEPIMKGEERAQVEVVIGGNVNGREEKYTVEMYFSQENQKGRLVLLNSEGSKIPSPGSSLDMIIGNISFDIDEFISLSKTKSGGFSKEGGLKQVEILKSFLPLEIRKELHQIDVDIKDIKEQRTEINREIKTLTEHSKHEYTDQELLDYKTVKEIEPIQEKIKNIGEASVKYSNALRKQEESIKLLANLKKEAVDLETATHNLAVVVNCIESLDNTNEQSVVAFKVHAHKFKSEIEKSLEDLKSITNVEANLKTIESWFAKNKKPETEVLMKELSDANTHNGHVEKVKALEVGHNLLIAKEKQYSDLAGTIELKAHRKKEIFAESPLPVKHLSFNEEQVLYKDLPFNDEQQPSSTIIGVGVRIAMAMNPKLKVIVIKDGSLLDKTVANGILKMIEKNGYQLFIEMVDWSGKEMEIKFIEKEIL